MRTRDVEATERREYLETYGWLWGWRKPVEEPKVQPRKLLLMIL
jgi:hypothetical protein